MTLWFLPRYSGICAVRQMASAATLSAEFVDADGRPLSDAVLALQGPAGKADPAPKADMGRSNQAFCTPCAGSADRYADHVFPLATTFAARCTRFPRQSVSNCVFMAARPLIPCGSISLRWSCRAAIFTTGWLGYVDVTNDPWGGVSDDKGILTVDQQAIT